MTLWNGRVLLLQQGIRDRENTAKLHKRRLKWQKYHKDLSWWLIHRNAINIIVGIDNNRVLIGTSLLIWQLNIQVINVLLSLCYPTWTSSLQQSIYSILTMQVSHWPLNANMGNICFSMSDKRSECFFYLILLTQTTYKN